MLSRAGIEIEFAHDAELLVVRNSLAEQGIVSEIESYNHQLRDHWKVTTDSSCGYELVSPILTESTCRSVTPAMRGITDSGGYVNDQCGLHVHIEVGSQSYETGLTVAGLYHDAYEFITPMFTEGRLNSRWARFNDDRDAWLEQLMSDRYQAVNIRCLDRQPTVEFRQHQGTLNPSRAYAWMNVCDILTRDALEGGSVDTLRKRLRYHAPIEVIDTLESSGVYL